MAFLSSRSHLSSQSLRRYLTTSTSSWLASYNNSINYHPLQQFIINPLLNLPTRYKKGSHKPALAVPESIKKPSYALTGQVKYRMEENIEIKTTEQIEKMKIACRIAGSVRAYISTYVKAGVTTEYLDNLIHYKILEYNAYPSPINYMNFPKSSCHSVNDVICHGIPDNRVLEEGDILKIDISVFIGNVHGDCCGTFLVGKVCERTAKIAEASSACLEAGIAACGPNKRFCDIGNAIEKTAKSLGCGIPQGLTGHGIGEDFHIAPPIYPYANNELGRMTPGMIFTVEPAVIELGGRKLPQIATLPDKWSLVAYTNEFMLSGQFEETILITETGVEILTRVPYKFQNL